NTAAKALSAVDVPCKTKSISLCPTASRAAPKKSTRTAISFLGFNSIFALRAHFAGGDARGPSQSLECWTLSSLNLNLLPAVSILLGELVDPRPFFVTGDGAREDVAQTPQALGS